MKLYRKCHKILLVGLKSFGYFYSTETAAYSEKLISCHKRLKNKGLFQIRNCVCPDSERKNRTQ